MDDTFGSQEVFYRDHYKSVIFGKGLGPKAVRKTHESVEEPFKNKSFDVVLEIGGGVGEHIDFIKHRYEKYILTDIKKPILNSIHAINPKIECLEANAEDLPFPNQTFDRVVATCLLHHVDKPERVLTEISRVLKVDGVATIFLTCDPGILVRSLRIFTTARQARKSGFLGYKLMVARDHRNHVGSLLQMTKYVFRNHKVKTSFFPFKFPSWNLNGYIVVQIS
jgi:SAM-dependent methyltransferase